MGNSLENYRCNIGNFMFRKIRRVKWKKIFKNHMTRTWNFNLGSILILSVLLALSSLETTSDCPKKLLSPSQLPPNPVYKNHNFLARYKYGNIRKNGIKLAHWNQGPGFLSTKRGEIENIINGYRPHILGISEGTFYPSHDVANVEIENYDVFFSKSLSNPQLNYSRLAVYVHKDLSIKVRDDLMNDTFNSVWIECGLPRQKKILVCNLYRQWQIPNKNSASVPCQLERFVSFLDQWEQAIATGREIYILGDFNLDFIHFGRNNLPANTQSARLRPLVQQLLDRVVPHGFVQLVSVFTRAWPNQEPSGLDHFWTNRPEKLSQVQARWGGGSDHKIIFATRYTTAQISKPRLVRKRSYKHFDPLQFIDALRRVSWWPVYSECFNCENAAAYFTEKLNEILNEMAPIRTFQIRTKYIPWMSQETKDMIEERNKVQKEASSSNKTEDWVKFKRLRNRIISRLRVEKSEWQQNKLEQLGSDSSAIWKNAKLWLGWSSGGPPNKLMSEGNIYSKPRDLAHIMNNFFVNKVKQLRQNLPRNVGDPLALVRKLMRTRNCSFEFKSVHPDEVNEIIKNLKNSKSCGTDNIDTYIIKLAREELVPVITHIINLSLSQPLFPRVWKTAKTIPLHKKNEKIYPKNFRPVSLLPICSKILERAVFKQIINYMETNSLIHPFHHGFRSMHNTSTALLQMIDNWLEALDDDEVTAVVMLDLSAAFDVVDHSLLLEKLKIYGFEEKEVAWMWSYLSGRRQCVYVDGFLSDPADIEAGVPQGSILGPLLYIIFTNDLPEVIHNHLSDSNTFFNTSCKVCGSICCFADDSSLSVNGKDSRIINQKIRENFEKINQYMAQNKLVLNSEKTHILVMATQSQHRRHDNFDIALDTGNEVIEPIEDERLLGCHISNDFKFNKHIRDHENSMSNILSRKINALRIISATAPFKIRKMIAEGIIISNILYIITVYGGCSEYLLTLLQVIQNNAARCVTRLKGRTKVSELLLQCGWLSVRQMVYYHTVLQVFKIKKEKKPEYLFNKISAEFQHRTRLAAGNGIRETDKVKHEERRRSFIPRGIRAWNALPVTLRKLQNLREFKKELKCYVKNQVEI